MERKITLQINNQHEAQELLAGLKTRVQKTQNQMKEQKGRPWILNVLDRNRRTQERLISQIKSNLKTK